MDNNLDSISEGPIEIEDEVWIGAKAIILSGVKIGKVSIIGAGAVVTKSIPPFAIAVGNPARIVIYRFSNETISKIKDIKVRDLPDKMIRENLGLFYKQTGEGDSELIPLSS